MTTPLSKFMDAKGISDAEFALLIGKDRTLVSRLRRGKVSPTFDVAALVEKHTDGAVPMQSWVSQLDSAA